MAYGLTAPDRAERWGFLSSIGRHSAARPIATFVSERRSPVATAGSAKLVERAGIEAGFKFGTRPRTLRHSCGYKLADDGLDTRSLQAYLGTATYCPRTFC
jgi:site-specific recombinase XerD